MLPENADSRRPHYARALLHLAHATGDVMEAERQVLAVVEILQNTPALLGFMGDPGVRVAGKEAALRDALAGKVHGHILLFLVILLEAGWINDFPAIAEVFFAETSAQRRKASGRLITARPVTNDVVARVEQEVSRMLGKDVHLLVQQDSSLLGGMRVQVGDFVIDGTVDRLLSDARRALAL